MKAFLLAAGLGSRLLPLTAKTPKPLLTVGGVPLIFFALSRLHRHGIREIGINLHHLGEQIVESLGDGSRFDLAIRYFQEPKLLGTGGAIRQAREFLGTQPFLLWNADTILDLDVAALIRTHAERPGIGTLALASRASVAKFGGIRFEESGRVLGLTARGEALGDPPSGRTGVFAGASVLDPEIFDILEHGGEAPCVLRQGILPAIARGDSAWVFPCAGYFADLGTKDRLAEVNASWERDGDLNRLWLEARERSQHQGRA